MLKGIPVTLTVRTQTGVDAFNAPTWSESTETVENVLICPASSQELNDGLTLYGKRAVYTLCIPKGDTHRWEDTAVQFFGHVFRTFGPVTEHQEELVPGPWNRRISVEYIGTGPVLAPAPGTEANTNEP